MKKILNLGILLILIFSIASFNVSKAEAAHNDNPNGVYHKLAQLAYSPKGTSSDVKNIQKALNNSNLGPSGKYKVLDAIDVNNELNHPMAKLANGSGTNQLKKTGFKAIAVAIPGSKKLFFAFAGSENTKDYKTAILTINGDPGQNNQAQLFINYILKAFPTYSSYKMYFTGHSLGGWLASKSYLDIRSANWLTSATKFKYGGAINKTVSGVYTFNALPLSKKNTSTVQWKANINGTYNSDVKNLYVANEWLNNTQKVHSSQLAYIGTKGSINTGITYKKLVTTSIYDTMLTFLANSAKLEGHGLCKLATSVTPKNTTCK